MDRKLVVGAMQVIAGAMSYGVLATFVRTAYSEGFTTAEVTFAQYAFGLLALGAFYLIKVKDPARVSMKRAHLNSYCRLIFGGSSLGLTGVFYYLSIKYLPVSCCVVLLMQSIWIGVIIESVMARTLPPVNKVLASLIVLAGTVLATGSLFTGTGFHLMGLVWGLIAALLMTISLMVCNQTALELPTVTRSFYIILGAFIAVSVFALPSLLSKFNPGIFCTWGIFLALFGTILPPFLYSAGMPKTGLGLGAILISIEIPVSVSMAAIFLEERVDPLQWTGVAMIITAIVLLNYKLVFSAKQ